MSPRTDTEGREPQDAVAISRNGGLRKPAGLRKRACAQVGFHWDLRQAIRNPLSLRFRFTQARDGVAIPIFNQTKRCAITEQAASLFHRWLANQP